jgi:quinol-cytochrome oxidoreductase complex cytochrome b subunit
MFRNFFYHVLDFLKELGTILLIALIENLIFLLCGWLFHSKKPTPKS